MSLAGLWSILLVGATVLFAAVAFGLAVWISRQPASGDLQ